MIKNMIIFTFVFVIIIIGDELMLSTKRARRARLTLRHHKLLRMRNTVLTFEPLTVEIFPRMHSGYSKLCGSIGCVSSPELQHTPAKCSASVSYS